MTTEKIKPREVRKAARDVRRALGRSLALLDAGDLIGAYAAAESAQHAAHDMKSLINGGGDYQPEDYAALEQHERAVSESIAAARGEQA